MNHCELKCEVFELGLLRRSCRAFNKDKVAPRTNIMAEPFQRLAGKKKVAVAGSGAIRRKKPAGGSSPGEGEGGLRESEEEAAEQAAAQVPPPPPRLRPS